MGVALISWVGKASLQPFTTTPPMPNMRPLRPSNPIFALLVATLIAASGCSTTPSADTFSPTMDEWREVELDISSFAGLRVEEMGPDGADQWTVFVFDEQEKPYVRSILWRAFGAEAWDVRIAVRPDEKQTEVDTVDQLAETLNAITGVKSYGYGGRGHVVISVDRVEGLKAVQNVIPTTNVPEEAFIIGPYHGPAVFLDRPAVASDVR
jgi:hypothetical protein